MKKFFLMVVMVVMASTVSAQVEKGFRMGVQVNGGISNVVYEGDKATFGYGLGWIAEYNFSPKFYLQSGLGLENIAHNEDAVDGTLNAFYLQLPINVGYRFTLGDTSSLFIQAGPTISYGLFGSKLEFYDGGDTNYFDLFKRFDLGVGGRIGVEFSRIQISLGAYYGLLDIHDDINAKNMSVNLGVAYMF